MSNILFELSAEVAAALKAGQPVVALESTIITHGMPFPQNVAMAKSVESCVRNEGAVPATIAVLDGQLKIGLSDAEQEALAKAPNPMKVSRADLAFAISQKRTAGTTVAATMMAAHLAGIQVFATGGIGGVHRGAETSFDISADLPELARTPVIVVCAGAKAILDLPKTLEVLETSGVPVIGYQSDELAAFWSRNSGLKAPLRLDNAADIAAFEMTRIALANHGGMLISNPIPAEFEIPRTEIDKHIEAALSAAQKEGVTGKSVTPYLLGKMLESTGGLSLEANIALVQNNAKLASQIAIALSKLN